MLSFIESHYALIYNCVYIVLLIVIGVIHLSLPLMYLLSFSLSPEDKWGRSNSLKTPQHIIRRPSLGFDSIPSEELSEILTALDYKLFRRIPVRNRLPVTIHHPVILMQCTVCDSLCNE